MRASTLFALTAAILIGLGVAVSAKITGFFSKPPDAAKKPDIQVLAAARNLFAGDVLAATDVRLRPLKPEEVDHYNAHKDQYLPAIQTAAALRVPKSNIEADAPILRTHLKEMVKPEPMNERLLPQTRAVNLVIPKERSGGGLIQVGEWVEVLLTSDIAGSDGASTTRTAVLAPKVRVIAKRDTLWPVFAPLPKDKPVEYTLEVNPYRAALIEYSRTKGNISILSLPQADQKKLEAERQNTLHQVTLGVNTLNADLTEEEAEEVEMAQATEKGELVIGDGDLAHIFDLKRESPQPPVAVTYTTIERIVGTHFVESASFTAAGKPTNPPPPGSTRFIPGAVGKRPGGNNSSLSWTFKPPSCPTCPKKR